MEVEAIAKEEGEEIWSALRKLPRRIHLCCRVFGDEK